MRCAGWLLAAALTACGGSGEAPAARPADPPGRSVGQVRLNLPESWRQGVRRDRLSGDSAARRYPGALEVTDYAYVPRDTLRAGPSLVALVVYDSVTWKDAALARVGDSVASLGPFVYVLSRPAGHPFAAGTEDARRYEALAEAGRAIRLDATAAPGPPTP